MRLDVLPAGVIHGMIQQTTLNTAHPYPSPDVVPNLSRHLDMERRGAIQVVKNDP